MLTLVSETFQTDATAGNVETFETANPIADPNLVLVQFGAERPKKPYSVDLENNEFSVRDKHGALRFTVFYVGIE